MDPLRYPCRYQGGFKGMRSSDDAVLELTDEQFSVSRPKTLWTRTYRIWAKWTAVTGLTVNDASRNRPAEDDKEGDEEEESSSAAQVAITTRLRGTGVVVVPDVDADELWEVLHGIGDLAERFPRPTESDADVTEDVDASEAPDTPEVTEEEADEA
jgi:hypothetical protein